MILLISIPAAAALTSNPGSIAGSNIGNERSTPSIFIQWRILNNRSATVSQYPSNLSLEVVQKNGIIHLPICTLGEEVGAVEGSTKFSISTTALERGLSTP